MKPYTWLPAYLPVLKRSMPWTTYRRQRSVLLPAIRLHSMVACGSWSSYFSRISVNAMGISVIPSGCRVLGVDRDSVPDSTHIFLRHSPNRPFRNSRMPSRKCSVISTSPTAGVTSGHAEARAHPPSSSCRMMAQRSGPMSRICRPVASGCERRSLINPTPSFARRRGLPSPHPPSRKPPASAGELLV